jgi:hypothetical protein
MTWIRSTDPTVRRLPVQSSRSGRAETEQVRSLPAHPSVSLSSSSSPVGGPGTAGGLFLSTYRVRAR